MKKHLLLLVLSFIFSTLLGCASRTGFYQTQVNADLTKERWRAFVNTNPYVWGRGADRWFKIGDSNLTEVANRHAPYSSVMSTMMVKVPDFVNIKTDGCFQVQIFGSYDHNSVFVYGPNSQVDKVGIAVSGNTLYLHQKGNGKLNRVIVRIGVVNLHRLIQLGAGRIEGRQVRSNLLQVFSKGRGDIYLSGNINLQKAVAESSGSITVMGGTMPCLDIIATDGGSVNVSGNVGIRNIIRRGRGDINIIGANTSHPVTIRAAGSGKVGIAGYVNLRRVQAQDSVCVFAYWVNGQNLDVYTCDRARVGFAGYTQNLNANAADGSRFQGRYLHAQNVYIRTKNAAHANVTADNRIFAAAADNSSIYFFGSPKILSQFVIGNGVVIPIWTQPAPRLVAPYSPPRGQAVLAGEG